MLSWAGNNILFENINYLNVSLLRVNWSGTGTCVNHVVTCSRPVLGYLFPLNCFTITKGSSEFGTFTVEKRYLKYK